MQPDRPNMVIVMSDQHNKHVAGCYGDPVASTPSLDHLASTGVLFGNAYCPFPLCAPARAAFMTGREPSEIRVYDNPSVLGSDVPTFAHALGAGGYETVLCGRMHFNGPDQRHGFQRRIFPEVSGHAVGMLTDTNGFRRVSLEKSGPGKNHYLLYDEECVGEAVTWLRDRARGPGERPFCLVIGLVGPHCPFVCPPELFEKYFDAVSVPEYSEDDFRRMHPYHQRFRERSRIADATTHEIRRTRAAYYGMVEFDDRLIEQVLETLNQSGLRGNTLVVYTTDHGEMAGEHGLWWKMSFYEGSAGVPLIVSFPGHIREGAREETPASLIDLAPTLTDLAGTDEIPGMSGRSLVPQLIGEGSDPARGVFSEMFINSRIWPEVGASGGPARMLRRGEWKCSYYHGERPELFNLAEDPDEMQDRSGSPEAKEILDSMTAEVLAGWDPEELQADMDRCDAMRKVVNAAPRDPTVAAGEYWRGPAGYGYVEPV